MRACGNCSTWTAYAKQVRAASEVHPQTGPPLRHIPGQLPRGKPATLDSRLGPPVVGALLSAVRVDRLMGTAPARQSRERDARAENWAHRGGFFARRRCYPSGHASTFRGRPFGLGVRETRPATPKRLAHRKMRVTLLIPAASRSRFGNRRPEVVRKSIAACRFFRAAHAAPVPI